MRIAIQGIKASFHEQVARNHFGTDIDVLECMTFKRLCEAMSNEEVDYAVMAIENSLAGSILQNYQLIQKHELKIIGEEYLRIKMNLMALPGTDINALTTVQSHPIAIRQCAEYLWQLPNVQLVDAEDTAASAKDIADNKLINTAAVANEMAASTYGLEILARNIETHKQNFTRFLILSRDQNESTSTKASLSFQLGHKPGSLADVLTVFKQEGLNLSKIQSVPIVGKPYQYHFYVDIEWSDRTAYDRALVGCLKIVNEMSILGEYEKQTWNSDDH